MGVNRRHIIGAFVGGFAAWLVILGFLGTYSVIYGNGFLAPFQGGRSAFGFTGSMGLDLPLLIDLVIPLFAAIAFVVALWVLSPRKLPLLDFSTPRQALADGALLGFTVWALFFVPALFQMAHPTLADAETPLLLGLIDHLAFGVTIVVVIFLIGGPVPFGDRPRIVESPSSGGSTP